MCLSTNPGPPKKVEKVPILPGPASKDDMVNDTVVTNITDRSKQKEARGQFRDYGGRDKYRTFDVDALHPDKSGTTTKKDRESSNQTSRGGVSGKKSGRGSVGRG
jgi:hypothetical protein|tara:strand:- start:279 stop:593 length:315 start_codon:yes stop_codon:yes gene_type:complete